jgi:hypothetical protein
VKLLDLKIQPARFPDVEVEDIEVRQLGQPWSWDFRERMEEDAIPRNASEPNKEGR